MLEKQYSRIIRWVHRAQAMSADGNFSDAILDVECARAELDDARQELLLCHKEGAQRRTIPKLLLIVPGAFFAVMCWALPLHQDPDAALFAAEQTLLAAPVQPLSVALSNNVAAEEPIGTSLSDTEAPVASAALKLPETASAGIEVAQVFDGPVRTSSASPIRPGMDKRSLKSSARTSRRLSPQEMFRLTEVGRKALQKNSSGVVLEFN